MNPEAQTAQIVRQHRRKGRMLIKDILYHFNIKDSWNEGIPKIWMAHEKDILKEIKRIITRGKGETRVLIRADRSLDTDSTIRLIAYLALGYRSVPTALAYSI